MNQLEVIAKLTARVPRSASWSSREPYGGYYYKREAPVSRVLYCVTPTKQVMEQFHDGKYDMLISHHPYVMKVPQVILHTALDCCQGGLNDQWRDALGVKDAVHFDRNLGWAGKIDPIDADDLYIKVRDFVGADPIGACYADKPVIESVVICTGLGGMVESSALRSGADCYILGEAIADPSHSKFPAMIEVGHTLTEKATGIKVVREVLNNPLNYQPGEAMIQVDDSDLAADYFGSEVYLKGDFSFLG